MLSYLRRLDPAALMKRILFLVLWGCLCSVRGMAQEPRAEDSLKKVLLRTDLAPAQRIETLNELAWTVNGSRPAEAVSYFYQALDQAEKTKDSTWQAVTLSDLGRAFSNNGQYEQSVQFFLKAIQLFEVLHDSTGITKACTGLGGTFAMSKKFDEAIRYFQQALGYAPPDSERRGILYMNLGAAYFEKGDYDESLRHFNQSREYYEQSNDQASIAQLYNNLGVLYQKLGKLRDAIRYNRLSQQLATRLDDHFQMSMNLVNFADFYLAKPDYDSAVYYGRLGLAMAEENHYPAQAYEASRILSQACGALGDFRNAYHYHVKYQTLRDSLINQRELSLVQQMHEGYQLGKKESEISALKTQQEKLALDLEVNRLYVWLGVVGTVSLVVILSVITFSFLRKKKLAAALDRQNQEIQHLNRALELKALRAQMDPHLVFNALNGVQHFLATHQPEQSIDYLTKVSRLIRLTLQNASRDWVKLGEEIEILKLYLQVEQYRFPGKFEVGFSIAPELLEERVPFLAIQPYVENAVLHGLVPRKENGGKLLISAVQEDDILKITVEDNGVGRSADRHHADPMFKSMGSGLVRDRLRKLSLQMKMVMDASIDDLKDDDGQPAGTRSTLTFGLRQVETLTPETV